MSSENRQKEQSRKELGDGEVVYRMEGGGAHGGGRELEVGKMLWGQAGR